MDMLEWAAESLDQEKGFLELVRQQVLSIGKRLRESRQAAKMTSSVWISYRLHIVARISLSPA
jgi:hypothetical protein